MTTNIRRRFCVLFSVVATSACIHTTPQLSPVAEAEIRSTVQRLENEMNLAVDALDCSLPLNGDGQPIFVSTGRTVRTGPELQTMCKSMVANRSGAVFTPDRITVNVLSRDAAYVVREGNYAISFKDGTSSKVYLVMTTIWRQQGGEWKMLHLHESMRQP